MIRPEGWMVETVRKKYGVTDHYTEGHTMKAGEAILIPIKDLESLITTSLIDELEGLRGRVMRFGDSSVEVDDKGLFLMKKYAVEAIDQRIAELKNAS